MNDLYMVSRELHSTIEIAKGLEIPDEAWRQQGEILRRGLHGCAVTVMGFDMSPSGVMTININVRPLKAA